MVHSTPLARPGRARRNRGEDERGQALILSVAFLAAFGLLAVSVLGFASQVQRQRASTERTAAVNAVAQGSAQFAIADTNVQQCGTAVSGTMKFASGDTLTYAAGASACTPTNGGTGPGRDCQLCILNNSSTPVATPLSGAQYTWTVSGEVDVNGAIGLKNLTAGKIGLCTSSGPSCTPLPACGTTCSPAPTALSGRLTELPERPGRRLDHHGQRQQHQQPLLRHHRQRGDLQRVDRHRQWQRSSHQLPPLRGGLPLQHQHQHRGRRVRLCALSCRRA